MRVLWSQIFQKARAPIISLETNILTPIRDALRRHYKTCALVGTLPEPSPAGRHRTACDACAKSKTTCDRNTPCVSCVDQGISCTYQRLNRASKPSAPLRTGSRISTPPQNKRVSAQQSGHLSVPFLLNYSAPTNQNPGDVNQALALLSTTESNGHDADVDVDVDLALPSFEVEAYTNDLFFEESWAFFFGPHPTPKFSRDSPLPEGVDDPEQRQLAANRMIECLSTACSTYACKQFDLDLGHVHSFFTQENVRDFIEAYFEQTVRPRSRIVLKSSFVLGSTSAPLLLAIFLLGATCGHSDGAKSQAILYADIVEFVIFENPTLLQLVYTQDLKFDRLSQIETEIIQAAILIMLMQLASPKPDSRRRVRIQRYPALVSVARATSLTKVRNQWHNSGIPLDYAEFLENETRISPPQFTPSEFGFDLPAEEKGIDFRDNMEWEAWAQNERKFPRPPPLNEFIQELLSDDWKGIDDPRFKHLNPGIIFKHNGFQAFQPIVFGLRSSLCDVSSAKQQIERALSRWMSLWKQLQSTLTQQEIYRAGITYHAPDLCIFARLILRKPLSETGEIAKDSMAQIHQMLKGST
ncbi:hypothetical protein N7540_010801 [Penicillium herquei]|nr:hypothetical protein N7540_010801 [Penicillium herquei]